VQDVQFLPKLWMQYHQKLSPSWARKVTMETTNRVHFSQTAIYDGRGKWKALAPVGWWGFYDEFCDLFLLLYKSILALLHLSLLSPV